MKKRPEIKSNHIHKQYSFNTYLIDWNTTVHDTKTYY